MDCVWQDPTAEHLTCRSCGEPVTRGPDGGLPRRNCQVLALERSLTADTARWAHALRVWNEADRPVRPETDVARIVALCESCELHYDAESGTCRHCGCRVSAEERRRGLRLVAAVAQRLFESGEAVLFKPAMATEHCDALGKW